MKRFYSVLAQAFDPKTAKPLANPHEEIVDLKENEMFKNAKTILQLKEEYELFWNRPTQCFRKIHDIKRKSITENHEELVFVQSIRELYPHEYPIIDAHKKAIKKIRGVKIGN